MLPWKQPPYSNSPVNEATKWSLTSDAFNINNIRDLDWQNCSDMSYRSKCVVIIQDEGDEDYIEPHQLRKLQSARYQSMRHQSHLPDLAENDHSYHSHHLSDTVTRVTISSHPCRFSSFQSFILYRTAIKHFTSIEISFPTGLSKKNRNFVAFSHERPEK